MHPIQPSKTFDLEAQRNETAETWTVTNQLGEQRCGPRDWVIRSRASGFSTVIPARLFPHLFTLASTDTEPAHIPDPS